jgi:signal transduction histidine kinase/CheY-like chemotaxis protein
MKLYGTLDAIIDYEKVKAPVLFEYRFILDKAMKELIQENKPYDVEYKIKNAETEEIILIHSTAVYDSEKKIVFGIIQDITYKKIQEIELEKTISLLTATLESTADGILVTDVNGNVVRYNKKFIDMWNIPDNMLIKLNNTDNKEIIKFMLDKVKYTKIFLSGATYLYNHTEDTSFDLLEFNDGRFFERYSLPQIINGKIAGRVWSFRDITKKKKIEADLIKAKEKAEESDRLKTDFLANMTHEIRTPMNSILGFTSLLNKNTPPKKMESYINIIKNSGQLLLSIIEDILDLSKIQSGNFTIEKDFFNIKTLISGTEEEYNQHLILRNKNNLKLIVDIDNESYELYSDIKRIKQILNNLVGNAIKFTFNGNITYGYVKSDNFIKFFVKDTGIGISDENIPKIFERFYQIKDKNYKKQDGTGLGLPISKGIITLLGGDIWVESEVGVGSAFYFTIPIDLPEEKLIRKLKSKPNINNINWSNKNILIIDDDEINFQLLKILLARTKIKIYHANNGEIFYNIIKDKNFDIIILNLNLPDISGYDIIEYIKSKTTIPIIIESSSFSKEEIDKTNYFGANGHIIKPIIWDNLYNEINKIFNK